MTAIRTALRRDDGMTTAEYAVGTVASCGFAGLLYEVLTSDFVMGLLKAMIKHAFNITL